MFSKYRHWNLLLIVALSASCGIQPETTVLHWDHPTSVGMDAGKLALIDDLINAEIAAENLPGAVLIVARKGAVVIRKAYGNVQVFPDTLPMTPGKIFDMASVTKPVATATSIMILAEQGRLRLMDPATKFIPEFIPFINDDGHPAEPIRLYHLLTHTSGLPPYTDAAALEAEFGSPCPEAVIHKIATIEKQNPPGEHFAYSCLGFITLAEIVQRVSGMDIGEFSKAHIFEPLEMHSSMFTPSEEFLPRIALTEVYDGMPLLGFVHDPLAQLRDGLSGNAGLFSSADDMAIFAQMMLNGGIYKGVRILSPLTVRAMTTIYPGLEFAGRGLGWDIQSDYASNMGDIFP
ncbi:MAG: serine hydrolase domain-containing protein, partial [Candidatus Marinimicrobia bacterium]|nr:serine hydrolase domain-containing protein [Candidatus Neomarinimicrobiota bacterium]